MANTSIGGGVNDDGSLQNTLILDDKYSDRIDIVNLENAGVTELAINKRVKQAEIGLKGDKDVAIAGSGFHNATLINEAPEGETAKVVLAVRKAKRLNFVTTGEGATDFSAPEGRYMKPTVTTAEGDVDDSISFGDASTVKSAKVSTGGGDDSIVFDGRLKGKTTVETGSGSDVITVRRRGGKGKLILSDFSDTDKLIVIDETEGAKDAGTFTTANLDDAPKWIKFPNND